ncbi:hypothetical protein HYALB_00010652 [Hymenoscyphus albidus]|uniref:Uncharacterized protein n=1 Tax=Hymenoscyphus albidus TaxID=595503 RepID=A0A9N9LQI3_9HELO|nr:hypothetical protein HYALB_00010652 [Hymenoscyphus albidus]
MKIAIVASLFIAAVSAATVPSELVGRQACFPNEVACRYGDDCCTGFCVPRGQQAFCGASSAGTCTNDGGASLRTNAAVDTVDIQTATHRTD